MAVAKVRLTIQDMTWERCVSRVESTLKSLRGVMDVKARLMEDRLGQVEVFYNSAEVSLDDFKRVVPTASGKKHNFKVVSVSEERCSKGVKMKQIKAKPTVGSVAAGLIASICCGGSLVFASIGLGTFWSVFGLSRYIPQALAVGALSIIAINYFFYRSAGERVQCAERDDLSDLRRSMFLSATVGLAAMAGSFVFLEWLNHAIINPHRFLGYSEFGQALIRGIPNIRLFYALASFGALALLWALPFPESRSEPVGAPRILQRGLRVGIFAVAAALLIALIINATGVSRAGGDKGDQHSPGHTRGH